MDVLDQSEVDALLTAVAQGSVADEGNQVWIFSRTRKCTEGLAVMPYDFRRPERVSKDQMRAIQTLHDVFARSFGALLSGFLRTIVEIKLSSCEQMTYSEFTAGLANPTSFNLVRAEPLEGQMCLELSPLIVYPIIDRLLGGNSNDLFVPQRPLTLIETGLISKVTGHAMEALREAWSGVGDIRFRVSETESNPQLVQIVPPNEVVIVVGFEVKMGSRAGTMNLCIPYNVIEPKIEDLAEQSWFSARGTGDQGAYQCSLTTNIHPASLEVTAVLARTTLTLGDVLGLRVGDIITTERPASSNAELYIEGVRKLDVLIGQHRGQRAVRVA